MKTVEDIEKLITVLYTAHDRHCRRFHKVGKSAYMNRICFDRFIGDELKPMLIKIIAKEQEGGE